ncbi:MAG: U32 family peptidase [Bacteroidales bacterium]|nr:U32 family peptidase [Bacteroidales bacterium]
MQNRIEIMSPVGSYESLQAAIQGGANAVYFGVGKLNMRSRSAANFTVGDLPRIVDICRQAGVRTFLTVNTIIYNDEIEEMHALLHAAKEAGISAVIASDMAVITYANQIGLEVHISTQCNVSNIEAVRYYSRFADVIVTARELPLRQVAEITQFIRDNDIRGPKGELVQVEVFAHGALCMSVSGKCYLSLDNYNYSANRGACLQPCRRGYIVKDKESDLELEIDNEYIMSPKDLCTIGFLDKIVKAGVRVLKIEGRGRSADYVRTVTECYREAVEAIADGTYTQERIAEWTRRLSTVFNRGFWDGYYLGRRLGEWSERYGSQATENKVYLGPVHNYFGRIGVAEVQLQTDETLRVGDEIMVIGETTGVYRATIHELRTDRDPVPEVHQGDRFSFKIEDSSPSQGEVAAGFKIEDSSPSQGEVAAGRRGVHRGDKVYRIDKLIDEF